MAVSDTEYRGGPGDATPVRLPLRRTVPTARRPPLSAIATPRTRKFRQAAFVYLHVGLLYEAAVWSMRGTGLLPAERGPVWLWLLAGAVFVAVVVWGLWSWRNAWFARAIWALHALRLPALVDGAFLGGGFGAGSSGAGAGEAVGGAVPGLPSSFYLTALVVVLVNLAFLARAGWDL